MILTDKFLPFAVVGYVIVAPAAPSTDATTYLDKSASASIEIWPFKFEIEYEFSCVVFRFWEVLELPIVSYCAETFDFAYFNFTELSYTSSKPVLSSETFMDKLKVL